jgi:hypothetical protein
MLVRTEYVLATRRSGSVSVSCMISRYVVDKMIIVRKFLLYESAWCMMHETLPKTKMTMRVIIVRT